MIGFFQNSMAKHHRLVFGVLLVFIVVSFVFYTGSGSIADLLGIRRASVVMGVNLGNEEEIKPFRVGVALQGGGNGGGMSTQEIINRVFLVKTAEAYRIPEPTQEQFGEFLAKNGLSAQVIDGLKANYGVSDDVLKTAMIHSWKIQQFFLTFSGTPAAFSADVAMKWKEANTSRKIETAKLSPSTIAVKISAPGDEDLQKFFDANKENFRIGKRVKLSYAKIVPAADAAEKIADPTDFELSAFVSEKFNHDAAKTLDDLQKNRAARIAEWKKQQAFDSLAAELSNELYEKLPTDVYNPEHHDFAAVVEKSGFGFKEIPAFPIDRVPADTAVPAEILKNVAVALNETLWRTDAIPVDGAVFVVVFRGSEPSRIPALDEVKTAVAAAWAEQERERAFLKIAEEKGDALRKAVAAGTPFPAAAKAQGFSVENFEFVTTAVPAELAGSGIVAALKSVPANSVTPLLRAGENVFFAKTISEIVPALDQNGEDFKKFLAWIDQSEAWTTFQIQISGDFAALADKIGLGKPNG